MGITLTRLSRGAFRKATLALATAATLAVALPPQAMAGGGWDPGAAAAFGVIGGLALGAAISNNNGYGERHYYSAPRYGYEAAPRYGYDGWHRHPHYAYAPPPPNDCYIVRERVWVEGWGWDVRPRRVCD